MRIAILADIHGNLVALEAALADTKRIGVDQVIVAGDIVVGSPDSLACWERVKTLGCPVLRGNHERYVFDLHTDRAPPIWHSRQFGPVQYAAQTLGPQRWREMAALPMQHVFPDAPDVLFVHGSSRSDNDLIFPYTLDAEIAPMFSPNAPRWIIRAHNHFCSVRLWGERRIVTVGSVGLPLDGYPSAQYTILEKRDGDWRVEHRAVNYDIAAAALRFKESGCLQAAGPMARLYQREVATAAFQIIPFLRFFRKLGVVEPGVTLEDAVQRFLSRNYDPRLD
ncbi:MAG TPA: metallophosphoesterase family protein [Opitutaceae bacterium]|nr:metallophosphoesterase family protein [Opitutaceae bacterium]